MISLEQIRLLEGKISRAIELIRVLKEENATLRRGLDSAQGRMKELESPLDGFKADQKEIEGVIVRALRHLDDLEAAGGAIGSAARQPAPAEPAAPAASPPARAQAAAPSRSRPDALEGMEKRAGTPEGAGRRVGTADAAEKGTVAPDGSDTRTAAREELDIF